MIIIGVITFVSLVIIALAISLPLTLKGSQNTTNSTSTNNTSERNETKAPSTHIL